MGKPITCEFSIFACFPDLQLSRLVFRRATVTTSLLTVVLQYLPTVPTPNRLPNPLLASKHRLDEDHGLSCLS